ncbi:diacylglycerol kinase family lipid kinase [Iamia sp. SCSIO 61187]|uniref:diacylglycerol/lipid kinase family protein n=1 Tax=Iamia sp. SCSIO 61187 TaxID=2722752 RepID=UPI001C637ED6|nr:diacylglycerol kinase family protein [Iamia sp. SCSIO 61187]QYG91530.1 diacylglycerol kinase family lipid kinase [Iamia sp. SCSIO 61187]
MRIVLVVNPFSSSVTARARVVIRKALSADHDVELAETNRRDHATRLAKGAAADGADVVVVLGGDGTLNEAANGLAGTGTALATLPGGSTNVFARTIGLPNDPIEATSDLLEALAARSIRRVGLGSLNGRYFLFHTGLGFDAAVIEQVERRPQVKRYLGHPLFVYAAFSTWFRHFDRTRPRFRVTFPEGPDPERVVDDGSFAVVLNTNPYTYLGNRPLDIAPDATLDSPLVAITIRSMRIDTIVRVATAALAGGGRVARIGQVDQRSGVTAVEVRGHGPFPYQVDGDHLGDIEEISIRYVPDVLDLVVPVRPLDPAET